MSIPTLTTSGAVYRGAWRAQDAVVNVSTFDQTIYVPPESVAGVGGNLQTRSWNGSVWSETPSNDSTVDPASLDGGPSVWTGGNAGQYTTDAGLIGICNGATGKKWVSVIRCRWNAGEPWSGLMGFEAWVANENAYIESGGTSLLRVDRGSSRISTGSQAFDTSAHTIVHKGDSSVGVEGFIDGSGTADVSLAYGTPFTASAFMVGPVQRSASSTHPPGVFTYSNQLRWSRCAVVECTGGTLNSTDLANLALWAEGEDFEPPAPSSGGGSERIIELAPPACRYLLVASPGGATVRVARVSR